jgi:hypothetical protein
MKAGHEAEMLRECIHLVRLSEVDFPNINLDRYDPSKQRPWNSVGYLRNIVVTIQVQSLSIYIQSHAPTMLTKGKPGRAGSCLMQYNFLKVPNILINPFSNQIKNNSAA